VLVYMQEMLIARAACGTPLTREMLASTAADPLLFDGLDHWFDLDVRLWR